MTKHLGGQSQIYILTIHQGGKEPPKVIHHTPNVIPDFNAGLKQTNKQLQNISHEVLKIPRKKTKKLVIVHKTHHWKGINFRQKKYAGCEYEFNGYVHWHMPVHTSSPSSVQVNKWRCSPFTERPLSAVKQLVSKVGRSDAPTHTIEETPCKSECQIVVQDFNEPAKKNKTWSQRDFPSPASKGDLKGISQSWCKWYEIHKCALCTYIRICMYRSLASTQAEHPKSSIETWWIYNVHTLNNILCAKEVFANFRFIWWLSEIVVPHSTNHWIHFKSCVLYTAYHAFLGSPHVLNLSGYTGQTIITHQPEFSFQCNFPPKQIVSSDFGFKAWSQGMGVAANKL